jgi:hypothetical protein
VGRHRHDAGNAKAATRDDINNVGSSSGLMTATPSDASVDEMVPGDIATAKAFGQRVAEALALLGLRPVAAGPGRYSPAMHTLTQTLACCPGPTGLALGAVLRVLGRVCPVWASGARARPSLLALTNRERERWMRRPPVRDNRVFDGVVVQNLSASPSFFASTTILIIGGLLAVLSTTERPANWCARSPLPRAPRCWCST